MRKRSREEDLIQEGVIKWRDAMITNMPVIRWLHAIPNGGARDAKTGAALKRQGVTPGVWDLHLPISRGGYFSLWIEVKVPARPGRRAGRLTKEQRQFGEDMVRAGNAIFVGYSTQEIIDEIVRYIRME